MSDEISKSVHLAIDILSQSREAEAKNKLLLEKQKSKEMLDIDMIKNEMLNENERIVYTKLKNENDIMSAINTVKVKAVASAKENELESQQRLENMKLKVTFEQKNIEKNRETELQDLEIESKRHIEEYKRKKQDIIEKTTNMVNSFGRENVVKLFKMKDHILLDTLGVSIENFEFFSASIHITCSSSLTNYFVYEPPLDPAHRVNSLGKSYYSKWKSRSVRLQFVPQSRVLHSSDSFETNRFINLNSQVLSHSCINFQKNVIYLAHVIENNEINVVEIGETEILKLHIFKIDNSIISLCIEQFSQDFILFVATKSNLFYYDLSNKSILQNISVPDGINNMIFGEIKDSNLILVGGNCTIAGFDENGMEIFWTITGDNVTCMDLIQKLPDSNYNLIVSSEDYDIRVFKNDEIDIEINENEMVLIVCTLSKPAYFAYSSNSFIGVYIGSIKIWSDSINEKVVLLRSIDEPVFIVGYKNCIVEIRSIENGEIMNSCNVGLNSSANLMNLFIHLCKDDDNTNDEILIKIIFSDGTVNDYHLSRKNIHESLEVSDVSTQEKILPVFDKDIYYMQNDQVIRKLSFVQDGSDSEIFSNNNLNNCCKCKIYSQNDVTCEIEVSIDLAEATMELLDPYKENIRLPKFVMYRPIFLNAVNEYQPNLKKNEIYFTTFVWNINFEELTKWLSENFIISSKEFLKNTDNSCNVCFESSRIDEKIYLYMNFNFDNDKIFIYTNSIILSGKVVQSFSNHFKINDINSTAFFNEFTLLEKYMYDAKKIQLNRSLNNQNTLKNLTKIPEFLIESDLAIDMQNMVHLRSIYNQIKDISLNFIYKQQENVQCNQEYINLAKTIKQILHYSSRLRVGSFTSNIISKSKIFIKDNNIEKLLLLLKNGTV
ncbi:Bardet-Biedl syndrome 2 protein [Intoshia linei]|uniref:Bardet-Biedl syndrome 2 protein n=1 Tax=Intoshia linei TaxID=1819745 RepID=A0A177AZE7_9BILA|nr:Bardet-Biedl syndrome 2 protein [Intoshia linei]